MSTDLSKVPIENRIVLSDDPIHAGRTASILISGRILPEALASLAKANMFFAVTPYKGRMFTIACKINDADKLVEVIEKAEKQK
jgi:hypothetical protein